MDIHLLIGLGNPGRKYAKTRHNLGFMVVDRIAEIGRVDFDRKVKLFGKDICMVKPETFMNISGEAVSEILHFYKVGPEKMLVVHDDLDLAFGKMKISFGSGHAGHNGIRSVIDMIGTKDFYRVRIGIGRPLHGEDTADYVLRKFTSEEEAELDDIITRAVDAIEVFYKEGEKAAMQQYNV